MNCSVRNCLLCSVLALNLACVCIVLHSCNCARAELTCKEVEVKLVNNFQFVNPEEIRASLEKQCVGTVLDSVRLAEIESNLESWKIIRNSEAWTTDDGKLHVRISQRTPAVRCNRAGKEFFIDDTGFVFPASKSYTANVWTIEGNIPKIEEEGQEKWISGVLSLVKFIEGSKVWKERVSAITVDGKGDIRVSLKERKEAFILGEPCDFESKFARIDKYFSYIEPSVKEGYYKTVNLKYNKQLICRRDI